MIGRRKHRRDGSRILFVPLRRDGERVPVLLAEEPCESLWEAAEICARDHAAHMAEVARGMRVVRAICEHPELEFFFESMDADTLRDEVRALEEKVRIASQNAARLLAPPDAESLIYDGEVRLVASEDGLMEPLYLPDEAAGEIQGEEPAQSADELFAQLLEASLRAVVELKGASTISLCLRDCRTDDMGCG